jgi:hypothetical protein
MPGGEPFPLAAIAKQKWNVLSGDLPVPCQNAKRGRIDVEWRG